MAEPRPFVFVPCFKDVENLDAAYNNLGVVSRTAASNCCFDKHMKRSAEKRTPIAV